jgi:hypothetical protein
LRVLIFCEHSLAVETERSANSAQFAFGFALEPPIQLALGERNKIRSVMPTERKFLCTVYVVLLNPEVVNTPQIKRRNPKRDPLKPCVYVGLTGLRVDRYFDYRGVEAKPPLPARLVRPQRPVTMKVSLSTQNTLK